MVLYIILLLFFGKLQEFFSEEQWQSWCAAMVCGAVVFGLSVFAWAWGAAMMPVVFGPYVFDWASGAAIMAVVFGLYAWGYFALLRRMDNESLSWLMVYIGGALLAALEMGDLARRAAVVAGSLE